ncbi:MAG: GNAT family N-acetyltransferase [Candidatus Hodarchaeales archaeon]
MIDISVKMMDEVSLKEMAKLLFTERKKSSFKTPKLSVEEILTNLTIKKESRFHTVVIQARSRKKLVGWLLLTIKPDTSEIASYNPVIYPKKRSNVLAKQMIDMTIEYARMNGSKTIEVFFNLEHHLEQSFVDFRHWYRQRGFNQLDESIIMTRPLMQKNFNQVVPKGFTTNSVVDTDLETLYRCYHDTFENSEDIEFHKRNADERRKHFENNLKPHYAKLDTEASLTLVDDHNIAGFSLVHDISPEESYLADYGIHPDYRGKRLGRKFLEFILCTVSKKGKKSMILHVSSHNMPAQGLYRNDRQPSALFHRG